MKSLLDDLDECNKELERFVDKSERLGPYRKYSQKSATNPLNGVRTYAKILYSVLCVGANCYGSHKTKLQLEKRTKPPKRAKSLVRRDNDDNPCFTVSFLLSVDETGANSSGIWQDAQIQVMTTDTALSSCPKPLSSAGKKNVGFNLPMPLPAKPAALSKIDQNTLQDLKDLCTPIRQAQAKKPCLGFCLDPAGKLRGVYPVETPIRSIPRTITLKEVLAASASPVSSMLKISRKERMNLAVILACSYLQLQGTPWLKDTWSKEDIVFNGDIMSTSIQPCDMEEPYIICEFRPLRSHTSGLLPHTTSASQPLLPGNPSLLSLGVLLLELYSGQTFEQYCIQASLENGPRLDTYIQQLRNLDIVSKWLNAEQENLSAGYQGAILHCVRSFFDPIQNTTDETAFRQSVFDQVVVPLQSEMQDFLGEKRR
jgi:hypothetical protein